MTNKQRYLHIDNMSLMELYLLSMSAGIALNKENRGYLQAFIDAIWITCDKLGIDSYARRKQIVLGSRLEMGDTVRHKAISEIASATDEKLGKHHDIKLVLEYGYEKRIEEITQIYKEVLYCVPAKKLRLFDELTRELYCLHGAMMLDGATSLRRYHLGDEKFDLNLILDHYKSELLKIKASFDENQLIQDFEGSNPLPGIYPDSN